MARREKEIRIMVSTEEYALIQAKAKEANIQVAPYIRRVAQNPTIVNYSYTEISNHTREIAQIRNSINQLIFTIEVQNFFLPKEITTIVNLMQAIFQSENRLLRQVRTRQDKLEEKLCDRSLGSNNQQ